MTLPTFKVFLSHRYRSPDVNRFFFELFARQALLQFEVDDGVTYLPKSAGGAVQGIPTNVTRLERIVRAADAFIGIYPISVNATDSPNPDQLKLESRYFRLELDLALRARKPALVFFDQRYKAQLACPSGVLSHSFDAQEAVPGQQTPSSAAFDKVFADFCTRVSASMSYRTLSSASARSGRVGVLLPQAESPGGYTDEHIRSIEEALSDSDYMPVRMRWPPVLGRELLTECAELDFLVVDVGDDPISAATVSFLHGRFIPALRLRRLDADAPQVSQLEHILFGSVTAGYLKDVVRWSRKEELDAGIRARIQVIDLPPRRISTAAQANEYFVRSSKRPVNIFLSYCGRDSNVAARISESLVKRFQKVFNYKDGTSIEPGSPWLAQIFDQLATSSVAIPLISDDYFKSGNCEHEAREIIARRDNQSLHVIPVKLKPQVTVPNWFADIQSERLFATNQDAEALAESIVALVDKRRTEAAPTAGIST
ncbi:MAG: toll/interleukin-1 receptor domain-containing protein [Rhodanobacteraceae bacterium]|nr:toll/interleukin-1 receptor domain-containing protein [Rhodanobacteraceae bacterium]